MSAADAFSWFWCQVTVNTGTDGSVLQTLAVKREVQDLQFAPPSAEANGSAHGTVSAVLGRRSIMLARVYAGTDSSTPFELHFKEAYDEIDSFAWCSPDRLVVIFRAGRVPLSAAGPTAAGTAGLNGHMPAQELL